MARTLIWAVFIIPIVLCVFIVYLLYFAALQEKCVEKLQYVISSGGGGSHMYWNKFKLPTISWLSHIFLSDVIQEKEEHVQLQIDPDNRGKEGLKTKLIDAAEDSLEKTKTMMEDTAKSAAEMAGEVVYKTADMVKVSLAKPALTSHNHDEL